MNLKFLGILNEKRKNPELKELISIGTCGLHTIHCAFQHGAEALTWDMKKLLGAMFKLFDESPSRRADYERVTSAENESDFPRRFCSHRWVENEIVAKRAQVIWPKIVEVSKYWKTLPKSKQQPGQGKQEKNKSYQTLLENYTDPMVLLRLAFFEEVSRKLNKFLCGFQTDAPMVQFLVDTIEEVLRDFCSKFILDDVMKKAEKTLDLAKLDMMNVNIHKPSTDLGFSLRHDMMVLKKSGKVNDTQIFNFKRDVRRSCLHYAVTLLRKHQFSPTLQDVPELLILFTWLNLLIVVESCLITFYKSWLILNTSALNLQMNLKCSMQSSYKTL